MALLHITHIFVAILQMRFCSQGHPADYGLVIVLSVKTMAAYFCYASLLMVSRTRDFSLLTSKKKKKKSLYLSLYGLVWGCCFCHNFYFFLFFCFYGLFPDFILPSLSQYQFYETITFFFFSIFMCLSIFMTPCLLQWKLIW